MVENEGYWENEFISFEIKNGILIGRYKEKLVIDLELAKKIVDFRLEVTNGKSYPAVAYPNQIKYVDKEARNYFFTQKGIEGLEAIAVMCKDMVSKIMLNFVLEYSKPKKPTKMFTDEKEALLWLEQFKKKC